MTVSTEVVLLIHILYTISRCSTITYSDLLRDLFNETKFARIVHTGQSV